MRASQDERYRIGQLAQRTRRIRIMNTLTEQECVLEVGAEETMREILDRYLDYNRHAGSYTWKALLVRDWAGGNGGRAWVAVCVALELAVRALTLPPPPPPPLTACPPINRRGRTATFARLTWS